MTKIKAVATQNFKNAGTGESFAEGKLYSFEAGAHGNYAAGGLVREPTAAERKADVAEPEIKAPDATAPAAVADANG